MKFRFKIKLKPALLDDIVGEYRDTESGESVFIPNSGWYIARPLPYYHWTDVLARLYHCSLVLRNRARVYQYAQDYFNEDN